MRGRAAISCFLVMIWALFGATGPAMAAPLPTPTGEVILTVEGTIQTTNVGATAQFDREMLNALGVHKKTSSNPFETGTHDFEGVLLRDVLDRVGARGEMLAAFALDGYTVEIPLSDAETYDVLLATTWNGEVMSVRRKGPLWVIYPVDDFPELRTESYSNRTIWQLTRIVVR